MKRFNVAVALSMLLVFSQLGTANTNPVEDVNDWSSNFAQPFSPIAIDYSQFGEGFTDLPIGSELNQVWGDLVITPSQFPQVGDTDTAVAFNVGGEVGIALDSLTCVELRVDTANNGPLTGFYFTIGGPLGVDVAVKDSNGNTLDSFTEYANIEGETTITPLGFGWVNYDGLDVATIEVCASGAVDFTQLFGGQIAFGPLVSTEPTCRQQLDNIITSVEAIYDQASPADQYWLDWALYDLNNAQNDLYWATDDLLSDHGTCFFAYIFYATYELECVSDDALVEEFLIEIQDLLSCTVENEIDFAMTNGGSSNLIAYAEFFEEYADLYADAGLYLHAVLLHFYAWLFAHCS